MSTPQVTLIWVNYNSISLIDKILESLKAISSLDYDNYELIIVDNHSTDGSFEIIKDFVEHLRPKIVRTSRNLGNIGGVNIGYRLRDRDSKYISIIDSDLVPYADSLKNMIQTMEDNPRLGAVQGKIISGDGRHIDSIGGFSKHVGFTNVTGRGYRASEFSKPMYVTYVEGAYPLYRIEAVEKAIGKSDVIFVPGAMFYYLEDIFIGLRLWSTGYKCLYIPKMVGKHYRSQTIIAHNMLHEIHIIGLRNYIALLRAINRLTWYKMIFKLSASIMLHLSRLRGEHQKLSDYVKTVIKGWLYGADVVRTFGKVDIDTYPIPHAHQIFPCGKKDLIYSKIFIRR